jgi:hypothetical protein
VRGEPEEPYELDDDDVDTDEMPIVTASAEAPAAPAVFGRRSQRMAARRRTRRLIWFVAVLVAGVVLAVALARGSAANMLRSGPEVGTIQVSRELASLPQKETA